MSSYRQGLASAFSRIGEVMGQHAHAGLVLSRYFSGGDEKAKQLLLSDAKKAVTSARDSYTPVFTRREQGLTPPEFETFKVKTRGRFAVGLGIESPIEVGLRLHHTYGTPIIPGSALKGVASHYCSEIWGTDATFKLGGEAHSVLFGTTAKAGAITFEDAWMLPEDLDKAFELDVMTPHHSKYYTGADATREPTDFDMPVPVPFLSIRGRFHVALGVEPGAESWGALAKGLIKESLQMSGVGAKTRAGYGRFVVVT